MSGDSVFALALGIGVVAGLRSFTAPAAVSWAARLGWIDLNGPLSFLGSTIAVVGLSLLAVAEYVADLHPKTPNRTSPGPLLGRIVMGGISAAALTEASDRSALAGALLGGAGGLVGAFVGYQARTRLAGALKGKDTLVALCEDLVAIGLAFAIVS
jgi:uncharacterized membrane protein